MPTSAPPRWPRDGSPRLCIAPRDHSSLFNSVTRAGSSLAAGSTGNRARADASRKSSLAFSLRRRVPPLDPGKSRCVISMASDVLLLPRGCPSLAGPELRQRLGPLLRGAQFSPARCRPRAAGRGHSRRRVIRAADGVAELPTPPLQPATHGDAGHACLRRTCRSRYKRPAYHGRLSSACAPLCGRRRRAWAAARRGCFASPGPGNPRGVTVSTGGGGGGAGWPGAGSGLVGRWRSLLARA